MALNVPDNGASDTAANRAFYDPLWSRARLVPPHRFNTWPLVCELARPGRDCLELAPGLRPRLPLDRTRFVDLSRPAVEALKAAGADATVGLANALPIESASIDFCCAFDIVEHVDDDHAVFSELKRVMRPGGDLLISVPLHPSAWTGFDDFVGHRRRYRPEEIVAHLEHSGFTIRRSAAYGMRPNSSWLLERGIWFLKHQPERALWWYNRVFMPLALRFQKPLNFEDGLIATKDLGEILLLCRRGQSAEPPAS